MAGYKRKRGTMVRSNGGRSLRRRGFMDVSPAVLAKAIQAVEGWNRPRPQLPPLPPKMQVRYKRRKFAKRPPNRTFGTYRGRFKRPLNKRYSQFQRNAVKFTVEAGGVTTSSACGYVGHGVAVDKITELFSNSVVKYLFERAGFSVNNFQKKINGDQITAHTTPSYKIKWSYRIGEGSFIATSFALITADKTWREAGSTLVSGLYAAVGGSDEEYHILAFNLYALEDIAIPDEKTILATAQMNELYATLQFSSVLNVQNQTVGSAAGDDLMTDVTNNPLEGKIYSAWGNGLTLSAYNINSGIVDPSNGFIADHQKGISTFDISGLTITPEMQLILSRPPSAAAFNEKVKMNSIRLPAGGIKKSFIQYKKIYKLQTLFNVLLKDFRSNPTYRRENIGKYQLIALQKLCRTGAEQPITLGFEVNQSYAMNVWRRKLPMTPTHEILTS